jgi:choline dehydrogenase-like flavoprotein
MSDWDHIVVGAGSAGCAVAYELAKAGRNRVLVMESGGHDRTINIKIPALGTRAMRQFDWGYVSQPDPSRGGKTDSWLRGRVLGGSSSINGMNFVRGARPDFDRWASMGNEGWSYADVLPLYREMERSDQPGHFRGNRGPVAIRTIKRAHPLTDAFIESAVAAGFPLNPDYNGETQGGVGYAQLSQRRGLRCSASDAFIKPLLRQSNVRLLLRAHVDLIHFDRGRATGVAFSRHGTSGFVSARHIILCAGAVNTPKLLMLSGIGDLAELQCHGIPQLIEAPAVGENLQEHPLVRLIYKSRVPSNNLTGGLFQKIKIAGQFVCGGQGPIASVFEAQAFLKTTPDLASPDIQLHFLTIGVLSSVDSPSPFLRFPSVSVYVNKNYPKSRGRIRLASADPGAAPIIECNLVGDPEDRATLARGISVVRRITQARPLRDLLKEEIMPGPEYASDEELQRYIPAHTEIAYHPVGTCRMGSDSAAVVTPQLRVRGIENLWIADASIMPDLISGNTNAVCMLIGMKLGRYLNRADAHSSGRH